MWCICVILTSHAMQGNYCADLYTIEDLLEREAAKFDENLIPKKEGQSGSASGIISKEVERAEETGGQIPLHDELEKGLSEFIGVEDCIVYLGGYTCNVNSIKALCNSKDLIIVDELSRNSILENAIYSPSDLEKKLIKNRGKYEKVLICVEGVFGDIEMNLSDSHISLIKQIGYREIDLSNNKISSKGLKDLTDSLPKDSYYISIFGNEIGDEGIEIICNYLDRFVDRYPSSLNVSNIGMNEKGLTMLIERLKDYKPLRKIDISENELNEEELRLMKENKEVFEDLEELSITVKENINRNELKSFLEIFSTIGKIKLNGIDEEENEELSKQFFNIE